MKFKLVNDDIQKYIKTIQSDSIDLTVTSPPYDDIRSYDGHNLSINYEDLSKELYRITKDGGVVVWVVADQTINGSESCSSFKQALTFVGSGFKLHDTMIYLKDNPPPVGGNNRYYQAFEYMFVFVKGKLKTFNPLTRPRRNKHNDKRTERYRGVTRDVDGNFVKRVVKVNEEVKRENVWTYVVGGGNSTNDKVAFKHPAIFPEKLAEDHILSWSNEGDVVFDPFCGSGTTAKVALMNNRRFLGVEINPEYCDIINERVDLVLAK